MNNRPAQRHKRNNLRLTRYNINVPFLIKGPRKVAPFKLKAETEKCKDCGVEL